MTKTYIKFETEGCSPCKFTQQMLESEFPSLKSIKINNISEAKENVLNVIDIAESQEEAAKLGVLSVPTFLTIEKGAVTERATGMDYNYLRNLGAELTK